MQGLLYPVSGTHYEFITFEVVPECGSPFSFVGQSGDYNKWLDIDEVIELGTDTQVYCFNNGYGYWVLLVGVTE